LKFQYYMYWSLAGRPTKEPLKIQLIAPSIQSSWQHQTNLLGYDKGNILDIHEIFKAVCVLLIKYITKMQL